MYNLIAKNLLKTEYRPIVCNIILDVLEEITVFKGKYLLLPEM
jgi:hypothetical protein